MFRVVRVLPVSLDHKDRRVTLARTARSRDPSDCKGHQDPKDLRGQKGRLELSSRVPSAWPRLTRLKYRQE